MKETFNKKTQRVKVTWNTPCTCSGKKSGGQQKGELEVDHHVQVEHYQRHFQKVRVGVHDSNS